jgi:hypothetical protein
LFQLHKVHFLEHFEFVGFDEGTVLQLLLEGKLGFTAFGVNEELMHLA